MYVKWIGFHYAVESPFSLMYVLSSLFIITDALGNT